ncbi:TPA: hypothetical protein DD449_03470 [Candidatus Berkelbacteria bacterium]|uniref:Uncharacterized protein n=1 Tax=Berkelbacteria bacterium GW2011_GWE1_39_12 TaxID=1618337 RepID=A0A0G4B3I5_9BACT|nr:MAG: hypothetical protein UT28_C0001G0326 [Berkelbacteria bacterium GW2011_GWE1_39_12]HBO60717.1 hypothetical protein [Candidatus Berkelbacteria bacterium]
MIKSGEGEDGDIGVVTSNECSLYSSCTYRDQKRPTPTDNQAGEQLAEFHYQNTGKIGCRPETCPHNPDRHVGSPGDFGHP